MSRTKEHNVGKALSRAVWRNWDAQVWRMIRNQSSNGQPTGRLCCYVDAARGVVRRSGDMGVSSLKRVFTKRPDGFQYAVISVPEPECGTTKYMLIDLLELLTTDNTDVLLGRHKILGSEDAAIAAAMMIGDKE